MGNVLRILRRDIRRLLKAPAALVVVVALLVLPSLYTWYNVEAFWNPYEATGNLDLAVVNEDAGGESELTGKLKVGDSAVEALLETDKLHFIEEQRDEAMEDLENGDVYAVFVIPEDFTECLISPVTGEVKSPRIDYYVNEKLGAITPKISDTAAGTLEYEINSTFVSTLSEAATQAIDDAVKDAEKGLAKARSKASSRLEDAKKAISGVRGDLKDIESAVSSAQKKASSAKSSLSEASKTISSTKKVLGDISSEAEALRKSLSSLSLDSVGSLSDVLSDASEVVAKASTVADGFLSFTGEAHSRVDYVAGRIQPLIDNMKKLSDDLQGIADELPDSLPDVKAKAAEAAQDLGDRAATLQTILDDVTTASSRIDDVAQVASDSLHELGGTTQSISDKFQKFSDALYGDAAPTISSSLAKVSAACASLDAAGSTLETTIAQAKTGLDQLAAILGDCSDAVGQTEDLMAGLQSDFDSVEADINLLGKSGAIDDILKDGTLNAQRIGDFLGSPTQVKTEAFFHPNAYGASMTPLFMNLTFWIGAFMLVIIFRLEVDDENMKRLTLWQRYLSRLLLFAIIAVAQAVVCCAGVLAMGVEVAHPVALFVASAVASLAYLSIIYALSSTLRHIGKALCVILVFTQIPGGSGLYPLELTSDFFQAMYPFLPFSYGIDAMREAIGGFYGSYFAHDMGVLVCILLIALVLGMALAPLMSNVTRMVARQVREGDLFNGEDVITPERPYRLAKVVDALSDREDYRADLQRRYERFSRLYPIFIRGSIVFGVGVPVALSLCLAMDAGEKVVLLTLFLLWLIVLVVFLVIVEAQRYSFEQQLNISRMPRESLIRSIINRQRMGSSGTDSAGTGSTAAEPGAPVVGKHVRRTGASDRTAPIPRIDDDADTRGGGDA